MKLLAQVPQGGLGGPIGGDNLGPFATQTYTGGTALSAITRGISSIIGFMTIAAGIWFLFQFVIGGFYWITSTGDKAKLESSRHRINDAVIGLIVVVMGWGILALASIFFGINFTVSDPEGIIQLLGLPQP